MMSRSKDFMIPSLTRSNPYIDLLFCVLVTCMLLKDYLLMKADL